MDLAIRYLLHGQADKYDSEDKLFIISSSDILWSKLWSKLAEKVLEITNTSWRLIDNSLSKSISEEKLEQLGITQLSKLAIIELLTEESDYIDQIFNQIILSDSERQEILNETGKNNNKELWRLLPLHKSSENQLVNIRENTYLQNPTYEFKPNDQATLINLNIQISHYPKEGWIAQWSASAEIRILLEQSKDYNRVERILSVCKKSFNDIRDEYNDKLKNTQWLRLSNDDPIAPRSILTYPPYLDDYKSYLIQFRKGYRLESDLPKINYQPISTKLFTKAVEKDVLLEVLNQPPSSKTLEVIVRIISNNQGRDSSFLFSVDIFRGLSTNSWLITTDNVPLAPSQVIYLPELETEIQKIINDVSNTDLITPSQLHNIIRDNQDVLRWLNSYLFISNKKALETIGSILRTLPKYYLGEFSRNNFSLEDALAVFNGIDNKILPAWNLIEQTSRRYGNEQCSCYILNNLLTQEIEESKLIDLLGWLSNTYKSNDKRAIKIYNQYLALAVNRENFDSSILPYILLLNCLGEWKSPRELCVNTPNIAEQHILHERHEEIIQGYLDKVLRADSQQAAELQNTIQENTIILEQYFQDWHSHVYSEAIGAFICLIAGNDQELRKFARTLLRNRDLDLLCERLLDLATPRSFLTVESRGETEKVKSLISNISFHAYRRTGKIHSIFVSNLNCHTHTLTLVHLDPSEYNREDLSNLLKESARLLIQSVYQISNVGESLDKVWASLIKSEQLDVAVTRRVILDSASSIIKFLSVHNKHEAIKQTISDLNESISKREEYKVYNRDYGDVDLKIDSLKEQLGRILEDNSRENTASSIMLHAVRDKIKQFGYQLTNIPFEIFQNADDALVELEMMAQGHSLSPERSRFIIEIEEETITMMHWGRPINCFVHPDYPLHDYRKNGFGQDLEKMLSFNYSDKGTDDHNVTGKFGLGFKSVHLICKEPIVFSNRIAFRVVGGLLPSPLSGTSNSTITTLRDKLELKLQRENKNLFDGTAISLPIDSSLGKSISINDTVQEFEKWVGLLLIFAKKIKQFKYIKGNNHPLTIIWEPENLFGSSNIQIGEVMIGDFKTNVLSLTLSNGKFIITLDKKEGQLRASLPNRIANIWVTAPTQEKFELKFIINASFDINTGRSEVLTNQKNMELSSKLGSELGEQLCELFTLTQNNWNKFIETLQITDTTQYEFWKLIWNELALKVLDSQSELIRAIMLGNKGMGYFLSNCPVLPNGLWGEYQQLVLSSEIVYIVKNILKDQIFFNHVFQWERVKNRCHPSTIIHENEWSKYREIIKYIIHENERDRYRRIIKSSPVQQQPVVQDLNLLQVIKWQLPENHQADLQTANQVGELINKDGLEKIKQHGLAEYEQLTNWLNTTRFLSQSNNYELNSSLLDSSLIGTKSEHLDESLLSAFAPDEYILNQQYESTGKDFFHACRLSRLDIKEEMLIKWILATNEHKRPKAIKYLEYLQISDNELFLNLLSRLKEKEVDWLQGFFPNQDDDKTTEKLDGSNDDKTGQDGIGNPGWGEPGEALAKLFYDDIYLKRADYELVKRGGYNYNHDFLLCIDKKEIEIEVKTIASKSFRLSVSEWKELVSKKDCYELFVIEHSSSSVKRVIRIQNAWDTLQKALAELDRQDVTSETQNIESLVGLQNDKSENIVVLNWCRLIDLYGKKSGDKNITFYRCNAKLNFAHRSVSPPNPEFIIIS